MTTKEIFEDIGRRLQGDPAKLAGTTATYRFSLSGEDGGTFFVQIEEGSARAGEGDPENAGCTIVMAAPDFKAMVGGQLNAVSAFMSGKLRVQGDMSLAMKLQSVLGG